MTFPLLEQKKKSWDVNVFTLEFVKLDNGVYMARRLLKPTDTTRSCTNWVKLLALGPRLGLAPMPNRRRSTVSPFPRRPSRRPLFPPNDRPRWRTSVFPLQWVRGLNFPLTPSHNAVDAPLIDRGTCLVILWEKALIGAFAGHPWQPNRKRSPACLGASLLTAIP